MIYPCRADIIPFVRNLIQGLQPYAEANDVYVSFDTSVVKAEVLYQPFELSQSLIHLVCNIINLLPPGEAIRVVLFYSCDMDNLTIEVENTGINLIRVNEFSIRNQYAFSSYPLPDGTKYLLSLSEDLRGATSDKFSGSGTTDENIPRFYAEIQKRLRSCFTQSEKLTRALELNRPHDAVFIQKLNAVIKVNLENDSFDTNVLCKAMSMSRTQLFRRLSSLMRQAPAGYIRSMRLQRAKELLESTDFTVSEIAFKTGFQTLSNFTRVFQNKYSILPSHFRRKIGTGTNE